MPSTGPKSLHLMDMWRPTQAQVWSSMADGWNIGGPSTTQRLSRPLPALTFGLSRMLASPMRSSGASLVMHPLSIQRLGCADFVLWRNIIFCLSQEVPPLIRGLNCLHHVTIENLNFSKAKSSDLNLQIFHFHFTFQLIYLFILLLCFSF